ncbi:MAG: cytochrome b6f subunit family protein [Cyanobacteria bacterium J06636_28]
MDVGQKVKVVRVRDRVSDTVAKRLGQEGVVSKFKILDGKNIGVVVEFADDFSTWFFEDELKQMA